MAVSRRFCLEALKKYSCTSSFILLNWSNTWHRWAVLYSDGDMGSTAEVKQYHPHIHAAASWFRKLENVSTLRSEWLMLLFNCSPCCPSNYLTTIASTFRAKVRSITNSKACCNWPTQFTKEPPLLPGSLQSTPDYYIHRSFISCSFWACGVTI